MKRLFALIVAAALLAGCGAIDSLNYTTTDNPTNNESTGTPTQVRLVSGVAVSNRPIANRPVRISGANGSVYGNTDANGNYSINVGVMTFPGIVSIAADEGGKTVQYYSLVRQQGIANINPLTNLTVLTATGEADPFAFLAGGDVAAIASRLDARLDAAWSTVYGKLQPLISVFVSTTFNPITSNYTSVAGLHNFFGLVGFSINNLTVTLTNLTKGTVIGSSPVSNIGAMSLDSSQFPSGSVAPLNGPIITAVTAVQGGALDIVGTGFMPSGLDTVKVVDQRGASFDLTSFWYPKWFPNGKGTELMRILPANVAAGGAQLTVTSTIDGKATTSASFTFNVQNYALFNGPVVQTASGSRGGVMTIRGTGFTSDGTDSVGLTDSSGTLYSLAAGRQGWLPSVSGTEIQLDLPAIIKPGPALITVTSNGQTSLPFYLSIQ